MSKVIVFTQRKDQKFKVRYIFEGGANGFGGNYPSTILNKIQTADTIEDFLNNPRSDIQFENHTSHKFNMPYRYPNPNEEHNWS